MPLMVQGAGAVLAEADGVPGRRAPATPDRLDIGLVNNMPDAALRATERQFARLLAAASGATEVRLHLFSLDGVPRGAPARAAMAGRYGDVAALERTRLDGLIVTGAEPVAPSLADEPYWDALTRVVDWAEHNTASTIWSCLAAHAAVLHLDGIARRRLPRKRFGLFECVTTAPGGLFEGAPAGLRVPHSRWNDLAEGDLRSHGYRIASRSLEAGIDCFTKQWASLFVFLQGHPEYDADTLFREYRRDVQRFLRGERDALPELPSGYFDARTEAAVAVFEDRARDRRAVAAWEAFPRDWACRRPLIDLWQSSATRFYRNWLGLVAAAR
ncbi:homoserine O-succinyltransferase MetA [Lichenibacterium dinghuense]|uniref:homoserine O-succinyltransferase MetA n=1 Tax=Lichenibacterium dinghuense TaxID=2895977 RepID=UPI001F2A4730|nr:homoserine O-succinyltransferase [Lichenibacterium sp. 6Y81]